MRNLLVVFVMLLFIGACTKDDDGGSSIAPETPRADYMPLTVGNYWVYDHYKVDNLGNSQEWNSHDSLVVTGDSLIDGKKFSILKSYGNSPFSNNLVFLRDSLGYLVHSSGKTEASGTNFSDTLAENYFVVMGDTLHRLCIMMSKPDQAVTVPAGTFEVIDRMGFLYYIQGESPVESPRILHKYYAENVGVILQSYCFSSQPFTLERRLVRYHVAAGDVAP